MKKTGLIIATLAALLFIRPNIVFGDAAPGDVIITLGENLNPKQQEIILNEMEATEKNNIIYVTNAEEHQYLGEYIPKAQIGSKSFSSSKITLGEADSGLTVKTNNINWVSDQMFINALTTAGVKDAVIYVTAPFPVSGTAGLTGLFKAYEVTMDKDIPEEVKQIANEEMVKTAQLSETIGEEQSTDLMSLVKAKIAEQSPTTDEALKVIIEESANQLGITLSPETVNGLVEFFNRMKEANVNWNQIQDDVVNAKEKFDEFLANEETQNFIQKIGEVFKGLVDAIAGWFSSGK
jgi:uncharacterized protein YpuA (DUF1002 family)